MRDVLDHLLEKDDPLKVYLSTRLASFEGASVDQLSSSYVETLYYMLQKGTCAAHQSNSTSYTRLKNGNSKLPEALANKLGDRVHLQHPLVSVKKNEKKHYILSFKNESTAIADILILAIPCPVYNDIMFDETVIPLDRLTAIRSILNGNNAKIIVPISGSFDLSKKFINAYFGIFTFVEKMITLYFTGESSKFLPSTINQTYAQARSLLSCGFEEKLFASARTHDCKR